MNDASFVYHEQAIKITPPSRQKYAPIPQHCPETGKTVCANVHSYPE